MAVTQHRCVIDFCKSVHVSVAMPSPMRSRFRRRTSQIRLRVDVELANHGSRWPSPFCERHTLGTVCCQGHELLHGFLRCQLSLAGLPDLTDLTPDAGMPPCLGDSFAAPVDELCTAAANFSQSSLRRAVKEVAQNVELQDLSYEQFEASLMQQFRLAGCAREQLLVALYFCSDIVIRAARTSSKPAITNCCDYCHNFVEGPLSIWAHQLGGWDCVVSNSVRLVIPKVIFGIGFLVVATVLLVFCLKRR